MNLRNVLRAYSLLRQLSDDETALLETLRQTNENERALLVEAMSDRPPQKKSSKKAAGGSGRSKRATEIAGTLRKSLESQQRVVLATDVVERDTEEPVRCQFTRSDGNPCKLLPDHNIHHLPTAVDYHEFQPAATSAAGSGG